MKSFNPELPSAYADISATSWKALARFRPLHWLAIEGDIRPTVSTNGSFGERSEAQTLGGYAVVLTGTGDFDLFFKGGVNAYTLTATPGFGVGQHSGLAFALGAGLQWRFGHFGMRFEFEDLPSLASTNGLQAGSLEVMMFLP